MSGIIPIPSTRISGLLTRQRLTQQYQADQLDLFRLQEQISTGQRISLPSEDAPAASRAISLQSLLSRKGQLGTNINLGLQFLGSADSAISEVSSKLSEIKASTLGVIDTVATQDQRDAAISEINNAIESLVTLGNRKFNGRYLFAGSQTSDQPFSFEDGNVVYHGDDRSVRSFSDLGVLFATNATGQDVFGGISAPVKGSVDLNPQLHADTLLSSLRGGRGINPNGSLQITDAVTNEESIIDISNASTVGDVIRLIEDNPPFGSAIEVAINDNGLTLQLLNGNAFVVTEVGIGITARELGVLSGPATSIAGEDLDPLLLKTTKLEDLLGTKARASLKIPGTDNDILIQGSSNGVALDGVTVSLVDGGGAPLDVVFDGGQKTLTITIEEGVTTAQDVVDAINDDLNFTATLDLVDSSSVIEAGTGLVAPTIFYRVITVGGSGQTFEQSSGIRIVNGGKTYDISFTDDETVEDLLNRLNGSEAGLHAEINSAGNGINVRSRLSGQDFQIGEIGGGNTATQLGIRTYDGNTLLSDFNYGVGVPTRDAFETNITYVDGVITTSDGTSFNVDFSAVTNLNEAVIAINAAAGGIVDAQLDPGNPNVIQLIDHTEGTERLSISQSGVEIGIIGGIDISTPSADLSITASNGDLFAIDITGAKTVQEVLDLINTDAGNDDGGGTRLVRAQLAESGNGIELVDEIAGGGNLVVTRLEGSQAAEYLGLVDIDQVSNSSSTGTLTGTDRNFQETDSVFTTLIRLRDALEVNDRQAIERAAARIDDDIQRVTFAQADIGARYQGLQLTQYNLQDEVIQLRSALSDEIDVDLVQAISDLTARQISLQASLQATANILQLSLLNFL